ncbi:hypothetical protein C4D60_Mb04t33870 [Musa balbisiana]|uniref:UBC core domain-containing protein n=1 Tax=Musa balbisiana TaxID=52838 RepID=A0A4S8KGK4_MUSBA|nr:hypothetical protein C4D60_Mb04t33870 [Musa balbisiana]
MLRVQSTIGDFKTSGRERPSSSPSPISKPLSLIFAPCRVESREQRRSFRERPPQSRSPFLSATSEPDKEAGSGMSTTKNRRQKDITKLMMKDYKVEMESDDSKNMAGLYEGGVWKLRVELPDECPFKSPSIYFVNNIFHPNIFSMCSKITFHNFSTPNPLNPLNEEAACLMITDHSAYEQKVKGDSWTREVYIGRSLKITIDARME